MARKVHFAGIGGVGMAALAILRKARGEEVSGCDIHSSPRTLWLEQSGVRVFQGHSPDHLDGVDELVVTNAVRDSNPDVAEARRRGIRIVRRGDALAGIVSSRDSIAVCGSHGKTTTSTFIARLLASLGEKISWAIGGETGSFPVAGVCEGFSSGAGTLVVEADESDGTLSGYAASTLVVTNCEWDHPDHFKSFAEYKTCFDRARARSRETIECEQLEPFPRGFEGGVFDFILDLPPHNARNARAAAEVALRRGHSASAIADALGPIVRELPDRRFQTIAPAGPLGAVVTDYAHHPTEMKCAVSMARKLAPGRLRVLFQPHRYSRTKALLESFADAFPGADEIVLCPTYAAFEQYVEGGGIASLYAELRKRGLDVLLARNCEEAWRHAFLSSGEGDLTLLLGAGDIVNLAPQAAAAMRTGRGTLRWKSLKEFSFFRTGGRTCGGGVRRIVGMGSNLWISDLSTDIEYLRLPADVEPEKLQDGAVLAGAGTPGARLRIPWMAGIPGTVGGWAAMNAGAFGHSFSEVVRRVKIDGCWKTPEECGFAYRKSAIGGIVEEVEVAAVPGDPQEYLSKRKCFPQRCCGSVFKNPPGMFAGKLLEEAGAKNLSVGGASVWSGHANVIFAGEGATSSDILALSMLMREKVASRFGIDLESEIDGLNVPLC